MKKSYTGTCHGGSVGFTAKIDLAAGTIKCNCAICTKSRMWSAIVPPEDFNLTRGEPDLADYAPDGAHHFFCKHCGIRPFARAEFPDGMKFVVRVSCLDDVDLNVLVNAPITYFDGRNDNYTSAPAETRHL